MTKLFLEKFFRAPAVELEAGIEEVGKIERIILNKKPFKIAEEYWNTLGPGLVTGAADDDPSGIGTYSQTGAQYGFQLIWLTLFTFPFMATVQEMCARIGIVTGEGLAANIRRRYSKKVLYTCAFLLFFANTLNIGADLGIMAESANLLFPGIHFNFFIVAFALICLLLQIFTTYARYSKYLKYLCLVFISYIFSAIAVRLNWGEAFRHAVIPSLSFTKDQIFLICAFLGTTISPYLFFWQTSQEVEEEILKGEISRKERRLHVSKKEIIRMKIDVWSGMFFSNIISFFIIAACAGTLFVGGITTISSAAEAAMALKPFAGDLGYYLFALGIIGTGMLAIPVLSGSTSYAISESFGWRYGLYRKLKEAYAFYGVIIVSMFLGIIMNFLHINPVKALIYSAVANGIIAPFILVLVVQMSSDKKIMKKWVNTRFASVCGWFIVGIMLISGIAAISTIFL
jgi:NRAMP (natural resistance-associated macrophage protein)-like metal ion transporter